ncbi:OsmC family protein [Ruania alba]|uniref:Uncharacterized OsmC-related protein n=1 Tax=Ruania alba TaxID=648782 RepID=A0A1H5MPD5_9MICO|nr:OsmC family protein [Ruania alba]SEE91219.1 Uncharacterized OsmC-related protein [Ruania alba]
MTTTESDARTNGVDLNQLTQTVEAIQADGNVAQFQFRAQNDWIDGGHSRTRIQGFWGAGTEDESRTTPFVLDGDEPPVLLGSNQAPNAVEVVLHALASCLAVGMAYNAAAQGITIRSMQIELTGSLDLHGFLALEPQSRPGYQKVEVTYRIDSDGSPEAIDELAGHVQRTSPVLDILRNPVEVTIARS